MMKKYFSVTALNSILNHLIPTSVFTIAYSGGLDSHVLLHAMAECQKKHPKVSIHVVHVNHQLNPQSDAWALHCQKICDELHLPIYIEKITLELKPGDSLEEKARQARYDVLKKYVKKETVLLTAHNLNDQAETFLLQALRGAGPKGLSAMPMQKHFSEGVLLRPLLSFSRDALEKYARENNLQWIEDDSNVDPRFRRNFLRHDIFPLLKKYYPAVMQNVSRSARLCAEHEEIVTAMIQQDFEFIKTEVISKIDLKKLKQFSDEKQRLLLREWFSRNHQRMPNEKHLKQIQKDVIHAAPDAHPLFCLESIRLRRHLNYLIMTCVESFS
jgi:tRNA(Ile)-lysidine synthase